MSATLDIRHDGVIIAGFCIPIRHVQQRYANDCWATCLGMIFQWKQINIDREAIFTAGPLHIPQYTYGQMATLAEANRVSRKLSDEKVKFSSVSNEAVRASNADTWIQYIKYKRVSAGHVFVGKPLPNTRRL
jgi:hypothetical protein